MDFSQIKIIGFDLDQTLYPKSPEIDAAIQIYLYQQISSLHGTDMEESGRMFKELYQNGKGMSGSKTLMKLGFPEEKARNLVQEALENADIAKFLQPNLELISFLHQLKGKYEALDILTGSNTNNASIKLKKLQIPENLFSHILTADHASKSDLSLYTMWLAFYPEVSPESFLYIGDRASSDFEKPKELGIRSVLVNIKTPDEKYDCIQLPSFLDLARYI